MPRTPIVAGNWKMFTTAATGRTLAAAIVEGVGNLPVQVVVCPPYPYLAPIAEVIKGSPVALGAQNLYPSTQGAYTGEVSPTMLRDVGCRYVIVGHSERRHGLGEKDAFINHKVRVGLDAGLIVILCVGETLDERQADQSEIILDRQVSEGLQGVPAASLASLVLAYEPAWAIGTGVNATPEQAETAHAFLRQRIGQLYGEEAAARLPIQYGGSVKPDNAVALMRLPDVDGALVGGASLQADSFLAIVRAAAQ